MNCFSPWVRYNLPTPLKRNKLGLIGKKGFSILKLCNPLLARFNNLSCIPLEIWYEQKTSKTLGRGITPKLCFLLSVRLLLLSISVSTYISFPEIPSEICSEQKCDGRTKWLIPAHSPMGI